MQRVRQDSNHSLTAIRDERAEIKVRVARYISLFLSLMLQTALARVTEIIDVMRLRQIIKELKRGENSTLYFRSLVEWPESVRAAGVSFIRELARRIRNQIDAIASATTGVLVMQDAAASPTALGFRAAGKVLSLLDVLPVVGHVASAVTSAGAVLAQREANDRQSSLFTTIDRVVKRSGHDLRAVEPQLVVEELAVSLTRVFAPNLMRLQGSNFGASAEIIADVVFAVVMAALADACVQHKDDDTKDFESLVDDIVARVLAVNRLTSWASRVKRFLKFGGDNTFVLLDGSINVTVEQFVFGAPLVGVERHGFESPRCQSCKKCCAVDRDGEFVMRCGSVYRA